MAKTKFWYLKDFNFIEACDDEMRDFIHQHTSMKCFGKKQSIYFPADPANTIFLALLEIAGRVTNGRLKHIAGVPSSLATEEKARQLGIPLTTL